MRPTGLQRPASGDDAQRLASLLTGDSASEHGRGGMSPRQPGGMSPGQPGADLGKQIDDARDHTIAIGDGTHTSRSDDRARIGTAPDAPLVTDPTLTRAPSRSEAPVTGRIAIGTIEEDDRTSLTPEVVLDRINTLYMLGLQRCYRRGLELDATLSGRVAISFTVDERGHVIDAHASGGTPAVAGCIQKLMGGWRFPIPRDKDGDPTDASFAVSLALQPS